MNRYLHYATAASLFFGCLPYRTTQKPEPTLVIEDHYDSAPAETTSSTAARQTPWWETFGDPVLNALVERAIASSPDIRSSFARIRQADAVRRQARSAYFPQINAQGDLGYSRSLSGALGTSDAYTASASIPVSYEIDLFGRIDANYDAARLGLFAARADTETAALSLSASVAEGWYDVIEARSRRAILESQTERNESVLNLLRLRFAQGLSSAVDVHQQHELVLATQASLQQVKALERVTQHQLAVLLGSAPGDLPETRSAGALPPLPEFEPSADIGVPANLLRDRPDVRAAQLRVKQADYSVGVALASRFPSLTLNGSVGQDWLRVEGELSQQVDSDGDGVADTAASQPFETSNNGWVWNAGATLSVPLFDGGNLLASTDEARGALAEAVANYDLTILNAIMEVENAIVQERAEATRRSLLQQQLEVATLNVEASRQRYQQGLSDFLPVLNALVSSLNTELELLSSHRLLISYRIQLQRALGGSWTEGLGAKSDRVAS